MNNEGDVVGTWKESPASVLSSLSDSFGGWSVINRQGAQAEDEGGGAGVGGEGRVY